MSSWSVRRKQIYAGSAIVILVAILAVSFFHYFYKTPTCFDGLKNGNEKGVDCGGSCQKLCASAFLPPRVDWVRYEQIAPGLYNLAAYIENPNADAGAHQVPFHMILYDRIGVPIAEAKGAVTLSPHRNSLAFVAGVNVGGSLPAVAPLFEFTSAPDWNKQSDPLSELIIGSANYSETNNGTSLQVTLTNPDVAASPPLSVAAVLYDKDRNTLGFSKTIVDSIPGKGSVTAPFTWPFDHHGLVISEEILPVAE